jgi:hypothetical protein
MRPRTSKALAGCNGGKNDVWLVACRLQPRLQPVVLVQGNEPHLKKEDRTTGKKSQQPGVPRQQRPKKTNAGETRTVLLTCARGSEDTVVTWRFAMCT